MNAKQERQADVWEKWDWLWKALFYAAFLGSTLLMLLDDDRTAPAWVALLLTGILLLWHWGGLKLAYRNSDDWDERPILRFVIILGDIALWFALVNISPAYYFALFGLFGQIFCPAVPKLRKLKPDIEDGWRVEIGSSTVQTDRESPSIRPGEVEVMATCIRDGVIRGETSVVKEDVTQGGLSRVYTGFQSDRLDGLVDDRLGNFHTRLGFLWDLG